MPRRNYPGRTGPRLPVASIRPDPAPRPASTKTLVLGVFGILALAFAVRLTFWAQIRDTPLERWHRWSETDMATYLEQARLFATGDWLGREPYHPYHLWQRAAPAEKWLAWYGPHSFHQAPGYAYLLALLRGEAPADSDAGLAALKWIQMVVGCGTCVLIALLARALAGPIAGWAAGAIAALYAPLYYLELQVLREGPALFLMSLILLLLIRTLRSPTRRALLLRSGMLGLLLGVFWMFHEMGLVLLAATATVLAVKVPSPTRSLPRTMASLGLFAVGVLAGFAPLLARNLAVGVGAFQVSCRTPINFAVTNEADAADGGTTFKSPEAHVVTLLDAACDSSGRATMGGVLRETWKTYAGRRSQALTNAWRRLVRQWIPREVPDNTSLYFYREYAPILNLSLTFPHVMPVGVAAAVMILGTSLVSRMKRRTAARLSHEPNSPSGLEPANSSGHSAMLVVTAALLGALSLVHSVGRFRLYFAVCVVIYAGVGVGLALRAFRQKQWLSVLGLLAMVPIAAVLQRGISASDVESRGRPTDYAAAAEIALKSGDYAAAIPFLQRRATFPGRQPQVYTQLGRAHAQLRQWDAALDAFQRALKANPNFGPARQGLEDAQRRRQDTGP